MTTTMRAIPIVVVLSVALAIFLVREPLIGMFGGTVSLNLVGASVLAAVFLISLAAPILVHKARRADPAFRGIISEGTRLLALAETCLMAAA